MKKDHSTINVHSIKARRIAKNNSVKIEEQRLDEASLWITKIDRTLSNKEKLSLSEWLAISKENIEVFLEVAQLWDKVETLHRLADLFPKSSSVYQNRISKPWKGALAASIALVLSLSVYMFSSDFSSIYQDHLIAVSNLQSTFETKVGESETIILPDGSKIVLNTDTLAEVRFVSHARVIELKRGELHIDVAHDKSRPLSVLVAGKIIQAVGTAFNVEVRNNFVELIVTDGKVLVADIGFQSADFNIDTIGLPLPQTSVAISKGEKINLHPIGLPHTTDYEEEVIHIEPIDIAASLSWRTGNLIFRGESLADAMAEISRYSNITIELDDDSDLKMTRVAGMFKTGDINGLLNVLEQNFDIHHQRISEHKIFLKLASK